MSESGRIIKGLGGLYEVRTNNGVSVMCQARGLFRHDNTTVNVGDYVTVLIEPDGSASIKSITERKNVLIRPPLANLDIIFVVIAAALPDPILSVSDKLIAIAEHNEIEPVIVITKTDINSPDYLAEIYTKAGFHVFIGTENLQDFIKSYCGDKTSAFAGASGVGKSTLMNNLFPNMISLDTNEMSHKTGRGKHTTRHVQLYPLSELMSDDNLTGFVADTPGFSLLDFTRFNFFFKEDLPFTFREFEPYLTKCKYTKCTHTKEDGCKIIEAVNNGSIPRERHESYVSVFNDIKDKREWNT